MSFSSELFKLYGTIDINGGSAISQMTQAESAGRRLSGVLGSVTKQAMGVAAGFGLFSVGAKAISFLRETFIGFNADMEGVQIGFTTMMGSADAAAKFTEELLNFAAKTPFEFPQLQSAAQRMQAFGFESEKVIPMMTAIGDASAGLGRGQEGIQRLTLALGQMKAKGKIQAEEMLQLTEVGVNGWNYLAEAMGMTTMELQKMSQKGLLPANEAIDVIVAGMEKQFPGMMKNMEDTWEGVTSTIKDNARMLIAGLTQNTFAFMKNGLIEVRDFMENVMLIFKAEGWKGLWDNLVPPDIQRTLGPILAVFGSAFESIKQGIRDIIPVLTDIARTGAVFLSPIVLAIGLAAKAVGEFASLIARNWGAIKPILVTTLALFLSYKTVVITMELARKAVLAFQLTTALFSVMAQAVKAGGLAFAAFNFVPKTMAEVRAAIILTKVVAVGEFMAIAAIVTAVILLAVEIVRNWSTAVPAMKSIGYAIGSVFKWLGAAASVLGNEIQYGLATALRATVGNVLAFARTLTGVFGPLAKALPDQFQALYAGLTDGLDAAVAGMDDFKTGSAAALDAAKANLGAAGAAVGENVDTMVGNVKNFGSAVWGDMTAVFGKAKETVTNSFAGMTVASDDAATEAALDWDTAAKNMQDAMNETAEAGKKSGSAAKGAAKEAKAELDNYMNTLDPLKAKIESIDAAMEANVSNLEATGDEAGAAQAKMDGLNQKLSVQAEIIASLQAKHQEYVQTKGADAEATLKVQGALSDAIKDEAKFKAEIMDAQKAIVAYNKKLEEHQKEIQKTGQEVSDLADKYRNDLAQASADYYEKVAAAEAQLAQDTAAAWDSYNQAVDDRIKKLRDFTGLFDEVKAEGVSGDQLLYNLQTQVSAMAAWEEAMGVLRQRGISDALYEQLEGMGPSAVNQIVALANMTDDQLGEYVYLWEWKAQEAKDLAIGQMEETKRETENKISEMQERTAEQLEEYRIEWEQTQTEIKNQTIQALTELVQVAGEKGGEFISAVVAAIQAKMPELQGVLSQIMSAQGLTAPAEGALSTGEPVMEVGSGPTDEETIASSATMSAAVQENNAIATTAVQEQWGSTRDTMALTHQEILDKVIAKWTEIVNQTRIFNSLIQAEYEQHRLNTKKLFTDIDKLVRGIYRGLVEEAPGWGKNMVGEFIRGVRDQFDNLRDTLMEMANMVDAYIGFSSPTRLGPGVYADEWAPNLVTMFAKGIEDTVPMMQAKLSDMFNVGTVTMQGMAATGSNNSSGTTIYMTVNASNWSDIERELNRRGVQM